MTETEVCLDLFLDWLNHTHGHRFHLGDAADRDAVALDGDERLSVAVRPLLDREGDGTWDSARRALEERIADGVPATVALWVPMGADLPRDEPAASEFIEHVTQAAIRLGPTERSHVPFPIRLVLRKTADTGGVVSVTGGLNPYWARFTERVSGTYDLDSSALHRLPESEEHLERLLDDVVEASRDLDVNGSRTVDTVDAWTVQRLPGQRGASIVGVPPSSAADAGLSVRRNLKRALAEAGPRLRGDQAKLRALVVLVTYARAEGEGVTTALRGYDPTLYAGIDFVALVTDGLVRPIIQPRVVRAGA
jgi:hypothetical protein